MPLLPIHFPQLLLASFSLLEPFENCKENKLLCAFAGLSFLPFVPASLSLLDLSDARGRMEEEEGGQRFMMRRREGGRERGKWKRGAKPRKAKTWDLHKRRSRRPSAAASQRWRGGWEGEALLQKSDKRKTAPPRGGERR